MFQIITGKLKLHFEPEALSKWTSSLAKRVEFLKIANSKQPRCTMCVTVRWCWAPTLQKRLSYNFNTATLYIQLQVVQRILYYL